MQSSSGTRVGFALHKSRSYLKASDSAGGHIRLEAPRFAAVCSHHARTGRPPSPFPSFSGSRRRAGSRIKLLTRIGYRLPAVAPYPIRATVHYVSPDTSVEKIRKSKPSTATPRSHNKPYRTAFQNLILTNESSRFRPRESVILDGNSARHGGLTA